MHTIFKIQNFDLLFDLVFIINSFTKIHKLWELMNLLMNFYEFFMITLLSVNKLKIFGYGAEKKFISFKKSGGECQTANFFGAET